MIGFNLRSVLTASLAFGLATGCSPTDGPQSITEGKPDETGNAAEKLADGKADAWNNRNNPNGLRVVMNRTLADLPMEGATETAAWPDTYWPTYEDSTNARWQNTGNYLDDLSPMEKYDVAFNGWDPSSVSELRPFDASDCSEGSFDAEYYEKLGPAARYVSNHKGNKRTRDAALAGSLDDRCDAKEDSTCVTACESKPEGAERDRCEQRCDRGGVETWWGLCHAWAPAAVLEKEPLHTVTIPTEYGDINFTVGDIKALYSVIYDRSDASLIGGRCNDFDVKRDETTGRIISENCRDLNAGSFHVVMANLIGIQKRGFVEDRTFDYEVWNQPVKGYTVHSMDEVTSAEAHELLNVDVENPSDCISGVDVSEGDYCYNKNVDTLYKVSATLDWITESHASTVPEGAENLNRYSRNDTYTYILEVKDGEVVGGEWYGDSIQNHPDFVWLPFRPLNGNRFVNMQKVRLLGDMSQEDQTATEGPAPEVISVTSGDVNIEIPDNKSTGISSSIEVGDAVEVNEAKVSVDITHTYVGDLILKLTAPNGREYVLQNKEGGSTDDLKKTFTIDGVGAINGDWTLSVSDNYRVDTGTLNHWTLDFTVGEETTPAEVKEFKNEIKAEIPDNNIDGIQSYIDVEADGSIKGLELVLDISHTYVSDLEITLRKGGVSKVFYNREGGSSDDVKRSFKIDEFNGLDASGRWFLSIRDLAHLDVGTRNAWSLKVKQ